MRALTELYALWKQLGDIPIAFEEPGASLDADFLHFSKGTLVEDVWHWFEAQNPDFLVGEVLQGICRQ